LSEQEYTGGGEPQEPEQLSLLAMEDRVKREVSVIFGRHELVTPEGSTDLIAIADMIYPTISRAVVQNPGDRAKVGVTPTHLMEQFFSEVPGPAEWAEYDEEDKEFHEAVYKKVKSEIFRVLSVHPDGLVQVRLGNNGGMVLCLTPQKGGRERMAYVTRNRKCIDEDNNTPAVKAAQRAMDRAAALTALAVDRVPEHAKWFNSQYNAGIKQGIESGQNKVRAALEASSDEDSGENPGDE
jgi:hypothetical protein